MNDVNRSPEALFPIRVVAERTGVNPVTLRAWERRHGLIRPQRTPKGHRLYSARNLAEVRRILELLERGVPISRVKDVLNEAGDDPAAMSSERPPLDADGTWSDYRRALLRGVVDFDQQALEATFNDALSLYPLDLVARELLDPLFDELERRWEQVVYAEGERRFLLSYLRNKLGARFHHQSQHARGPRLIVAAVPGGGSEIAPLLLGLNLLGGGFSVTFLGDDCPLEELEHVRRRTAALGIVLSTRAPLRAAQVGRDLPRLLERAGVPVILVGRGCEGHREALREHGLTVIGGDLASALDTIRRQVTHQTPDSGDAAP